MIGAEDEWRTDGSVSVVCGEFEAGLFDGELRAVLSSSAGPNQCRECSCGRVMKQEF